VARSLPDLIPDELTGLFLHQVREAHPHRIVERLGGERHLVSNEFFDQLSERFGERHPVTPFVHSLMNGTSHSAASRAEVSKSSVPYSLKAFAVLTGSPNSTSSRHTRTRHPR